VIPALERQQYSFFLWLGFDIDNPLFVGIDATPVKEKRSIFEGFHYEIRKGVN